jgi:hypothetical protein
MLSYRAIAPCCIKENWCFPGKDVLFSVAIGLPVASAGMEKAKYRATVQIVNTTISGITKIYLIYSLLRTLILRLCLSLGTKGKNRSARKRPIQTNKNKYNFPSPYYFISRYICRRTFQRDSFLTTSNVLPNRLQKYR